MMGYIRSLGTGLFLIRRSLAIARGHPKLFVFPLSSAVLVLTIFVVGLGVLTAIFAGVLLYDPGYGQALLDAFETDELVVWVPIVAVWFFVVAVSTTFFTAALVHEATRVFQGERPSIRRGLGAAWRVRRKIVVWGVVSSTVSTVLYVLDDFETDNPAIEDAMTLLRTVVEASWWVLTFFIVPVMVFQETTTMGMFKASGRTFRDVWGETVTTSLGIGVLTLIGVVLIVAGAVAGLFVLPAPLDVLSLVVGLLLLFALAVVRSTATGIIKAGLYLYATTGEVPAGIADIDWDDIIEPERPDEQPAAVA